MEWTFSPLQLQETPSRRLLASPPYIFVFYLIIRPVSFIQTQLSFCRNRRRRDGISFYVETQYRKKTAWFIEELGKELKWFV
jgi:hypothetical protein